MLFQPKSILLEIRKITTTIECMLKVTGHVWPVYALKKITSNILISADFPNAAIKL